MKGIEKRSAGVLLHVSSLPGDFGIGSFGRGAREFVDLLAAAGYKYWQVLPFCIPDECNSPYKSVSAFAGNPLFLDLEILRDEGLLTDEELEGARQKTPYLCEYDRLRCERAPLLRLAAKRAGNRAEIQDFIRQNAYLDEACRFLALKQANGGAPWQEWRVFEHDTEEFFYHAFVQYQFHKQWGALKSYANARGVFVIGDLPIYVGLDSADVYFHPEQFELDKKGYPTGVAGVPPDYFSAEGQLWGNPLYRWSVMKKDGFSWWRARMKHTLSLFDGVRIDHFRAIESYWRVPARAKTAREGAYKKGPDMSFVRMLWDVAGDALIIAEDLGDIPPAVQRLLQKSGFPGMRVLQFAFLGDPKTPHLPHNYVKNCVAYTGTHDNNTLLGYVWEQDEGARRHIFEYCGYRGDDWSEACDAIIKTVLRSAAGLAVLPLQDLLRYGADTRVNTPGQAEGNWAYRVTWEQLRGLDVEKFRRWNEIFDR